MGYWTYLAVGSGVHMPLGKTAKFIDHAEAFDFFGVTRKTGDPKDFYPLIHAAKNAGYDTLQFTHRCEMVYKYEIVAVESSREFRSCPTRQKNQLLSGWMGQSKNSCDCDEANYCANCKINGAPFPPCGGK